MEVIMKEKLQSTTVATPTKPSEKPTLVLGASLKPIRYSNKAIRMLREHDVPVSALGLREGQVEDVDISKNRESFLGKDIHTVTMYLNAYRQEEYYDYIVSLAPKRVIFNPGSENHQLRDLLEAKDIEVVEACTLVMLTLNQF